MEFLADPDKDVLSLDVTYEYCTKGFQKGVGKTNRFASMFRELQQLRNDKRD